MLRSSITIKNVGKPVFKPVPIREHLKRSKCMKPNGNGGNGSQTPDALRDAVVNIVRTCYVDQFKHAEELNALASSQHDEQLSAAVLKYAFALYYLPFPKDAEEVRGKSCISGLTEKEMKKIDDVLLAMQKSKEINCYAAFEGKTADEAAMAVFGQLRLVEKKLGITGRVAWLKGVLSSDCVPNVDAVHPCAKWDCKDASAVLAANPELFAELDVLLRRQNSIFDAAHWIAKVGCDDEMRTAMIVHLVRSVRSGNPSINLLVASDSGSVASALASAMASRRSAADRPN